MDEEEKHRLIESMLKKAVGYEAVETQEEYAVVDGELTLVKRKITRKDVPPDLSALKALLGDEKTEEIDRDELERERAQLMEEFFALMKRQKKDKS